MQDRMIHATLASTRTITLNTQHHTCTPHTPCLFCVHEPVNNIGDAGATQLAPSLKEMKGLKTLDIRCKCVVGRWASATVSNGTPTLPPGPLRVVVLVCRVHSPGDHTDACTQLHYPPLCVCVCVSRCAAFVSHLQYNRKLKHH